MSQIQESEVDSGNEEWTRVKSSAIFFSALHLFCLMLYYFGLLYSTHSLSETVTKYLFLAFSLELAACILCSTSTFQIICLKPSIWANPWVYRPLYIGLLISALTFTASLGVFLWGLYQMHTKYSYFLLIPVCCMVIKFVYNEIIQRVYWCINKEEETQLTPETSNAEVPESGEKK